MWGFSPISSFDNFRYYVVFIDYFTKFQLCLMNHKSEVNPIFENFKKVIENYFQTSILTTYLDGGGEYIGLTITLQ